MSLPSAVKLPFAIEPAHALREIADLDANLWQPHFNTEYYAGDWSGVALRSRGGTASLYPGPPVPGVAEGAYESTATLAALPSVNAILARFECPLTSVRLLRLGPGAAIREHQDYGIGLDDGEVRVHVALQTSDAVEFVLDGRPVAMNAGDVWYLDVSKRHSVVNASAHVRIHLVVDCIVDAWFRDALARATQTSFERFAAAVAHDPDLENTLWQARSHDDFATLAVTHAHARGIALEREDVYSAMARGMSRWHDALNG